MSRGYVKQMLEYLTGAYNRDDIQQAEKDLAPKTNIGRLFATFGWALEIINENAERIRLWDDLDHARGTVLDRYGLNFGVRRNGADDAFYRLLIKVKMIALLSGGDIDTIINVAASLFDIDPTLIELQEVFPAKVIVYIREEDISQERFAMAALTAKMIKRTLAAGVLLDLILRLMPYTLFNTEHLHLSRFHVTASLNSRGKLPILLNGAMPLDGGWLLDQAYKGIIFQFFNVTSSITNYVRAGPMTLAFPVAVTNHASSRMKVFHANLQAKQSLSFVQPRMGVEVSSKTCNTMRGVSLIRDSMYHLDGSVSLDGSRRLNADIIKEDM